MTNGGNVMSNSNMNGKWYQSEAGKQILEKKYFHEGEDFTAFLDRVSGIFGEMSSEVRGAIEAGDFLLGGRSLYGAGSKDKFRASMSNCFIRGHKVITKRGLVNIEEVCVGDYVITDNGTWQKVNEVMCREYHGDLYAITPETSYDKIVCTPNHTFLTESGWVRADRLLYAHNGRVNSSHKLRVPSVSFDKQYENINILDGFEDEDILHFIEGDKVGYKVRMSSKNGTEYFCQQGNLINHYITPSSDFMYFIGRWIGDGSITTRRGKRNPSILQIVFNASSERESFERCKRIGEEVFGLSSSVVETKQNVIVLRFENPILATWFLNEFGQKCDGKFLRDKYLGDLNIALGLLDSDGMIMTHGNVSITLKNLNILQWLRDTLYLNGINCKDIKKLSRQDAYKLHIPAGISRARLVPKMSKTYHDSRERKVNLDSLVSDFVRVMDVSVVENVSTTVYNLSVENVHSYSVNGIVCHNCYILPKPKDNIEDIFDVAKEMARIFSYGGGCGLDISGLRPRGAVVNNSARTSTGAVSFMNIFDSVGGVIGANNRRAALIIGLDCSHPDLYEFLEIKQNNDKIQSANISVKFTNEFMDAIMQNTNYTQRFVCETGEVIEKVIDPNDFFNKFAYSNWDFAEPGSLFIDKIRNWHILSGYPADEYQIDICNPCVTGDTLILTDDGYRRIDSLVGKKTLIWNGDEWSMVEPRITGYNQKMKLIKFSNGMELKCTHYHKFVMQDNSRKQADELEVGDKLAKWSYPVIEGAISLSSPYAMGLYCGDGTIGKKQLCLYGDKIKLVDYLDAKYRAIPQPNQHRVNVVFEEQFDKNFVPDSSYTIDSRMSWLAGLVDSDGSLNDPSGSIAISSVDRKFLSDVQLMLSTLGCASSINIMHEACDRDMPDGNGGYKSYPCQESYRLVISGYNVIKLIANGFKPHRITVDSQPNRDAGRFVYVAEIVDIDDEPVVYCFNEPINHTGIFNGVMTAQCAEYMGSEYNACQLASINLYNCIDNPFTPEATLNIKKLDGLVYLGVRALNVVVDYGYDMQPLDKNRECIDKWRAIGLGVFGLADALIAMGIEYGSERARDFVGQVGKCMINSALITSEHLANLYGSFGMFDADKVNNSSFIKAHAHYRIKALRNGSLLSIAPTGSIATMVGCSGGIEPLFAVSYERTTHALEKEGKFFRVLPISIRDLLIHNNLPLDTSDEEIMKRFPYVVTAHTISPTNRIKMQAVMQHYVDNAISSTINMSNDSTVDDVKDVYKAAYLHGCKGVTVFRDGCARIPILKTHSEPAASADADISMLGTVSPMKAKAYSRLESARYYRSTACVPNMYVHVVKLGDKIVEVFTNSKTGCKSNLGTMTQLTSLALRSGVKPEHVIEELSGNSCPACLSCTRDGVSLSCGHAIASALQEELNRVHSQETSDISVPTPTTVHKIQYDQCPECGDYTLIPEGRCVRCTSCHYSKCD